VDSIRVVNFSWKSVTIRVIEEDNELVASFQDCDEFRTTSLHAYLLKVMA
jgi:hypothetical protein